MWKFINRWRSYMAEKSIELDSVEIAAAIFGKMCIRDRCDPCGAER